MRLREKMRIAFQTVKISDFARLVALNLALAFIYFLFAKLGLTLATLSRSASPVWPATGFAFAIVSIFGNRTLFAVALGAFAANSLTGGPLVSTLAISFGNTIEAFVGAYLIRLIMTYKNQLSDHTNTFAFSIASMGGSLFSATIGVVALYATGAIGKEIIASVWLTWWIGDTLGGLVVTPLIFEIKKISFNPKHWLRLIGLLSYAFLATYFIFFTSLGGSYLFLAFPILLYAARNLSSFSVLFISAAICGVGIAATAGGFGPFAHGALNERLVHLQFFLASYAITGMVLAGFGRQKLSKIPTIVLCICWVLAGTIFYSFDQSEKQRAEAHIVNLAEDSKEKTLALMVSYEEILRSGVGLFSASKSVEYDEWKSFNKTLNVLKHHSGINGLGVIWPTERENIKKLKFELMSQGLASFEVKSVPGYESEFNSNKKNHYVIKFIEPIELNRAALGLDVGSEPNRRLAAERSRDTGLGTITSKITLIQDQKKTPGALLFLPIYKNKMNIDSIERRQAALLGWVYAPIIYRNFFAEVFQQTNDELEMQVFEGGAPVTENLIFSNFSDKSDSQIYDKESRIQMGQSQFLIRWVKGPHFISSHNTIVAWVGFCGALASLLLTNLLVASQLVSRKSREIADELTKELSNSREKFQQGERRLLYALDGSNDGIWDWNIEKAEMYVSGKIAENHGWPQVFYTRSADDLKLYAHPEDLKKIGQSIKKVLIGESDLHEVETRYRAISGEWRWVLTRGKISERDEQGRPKRMTGVHIDIHELKRTQRLLQEKEYQLSNIANSVPAKVSLWNKDLKCTFANDLFGKWFGLDVGSIIGYSMEELVAPDEFKEGLPAIQRALNGEFFNYERLARRPSDGECRYILATFLPNKKDEVQDGFFLFIQDITDLKKAELQALEERKVAVEAANIKSEFLANMSHEIRTPLNGIIGMTNLLRRTRLDVKQKEYSEVISRSSDALLNLINDILDFSKVEAGKLELEIFDFSLKNLISDVITSFSFSAQEKNISIKTDIQLGHHDFFKGDPGRIRQVLTNLIGNAIKFTPKGSVTLRVLSEGSSSRSKLKIEILDTGIGIPQESLERMFKAFSQGDSSMTRRFGGSGLGLSICKQLVNLMDGEIGVSSEPGKGSNFWFSLELPIGQFVEKTSTTTSIHRTLNARILVVEDNRVNQQIAIEFLADFGYIPHAVGNGIEALEALRDSTYDIVLMDCQMPEMDGFKATEIIRQSESLECRSIPIIAMTANALSGDREKCIAAGMNDYVTKPIDENQLVAAIEKCLRSEGKVSAHSGIQSLGHILVVEDNKVNQNVIGLNLEELNYSFDVVENGLQALKYISLQTCDLILMDCQMPEMDGFEATQKIRTLDSPHAAIPIVALTANVLTGDREKCLAAGMNDFLTKPINVENLKNTLEKWLKSKTEITGIKGDLSMPNKKSGSVIDVVAIDKLRKLQKPGRPNLLNNLINLFVESAHEGMSQIREAVKKRDLVALSAAAHSLKSSGANLGALGFSELCQQLEKLGDGIVPVEKMEELAFQLEQEFKIVLSELDGLKVEA